MRGPARRSAATRMADAPLAVSIAFRTNKTPSEYEALAMLVDGYGFDVVSVYNDLLFASSLGHRTVLTRHVASSCSESACYRH
jgi:hypothetical protein